MKCPKCGFEWVRSDIEKPSKEGKPRRPYKICLYCGKRTRREEGVCAVCDYQANMAGSKWVPGTFWLLATREWKRS